MLGGNIRDVSTHVDHAWVLYFLAYCSIIHAKINAAICIRGRVHHLLITRSCINPGLGLILSLKSFHELHMVGFGA